MIYFINQDYFPSKTAGGSAKSIKLLVNLLKNHSKNSKVKFKSNLFEINYTSNDLVIFNSFFSRICRREMWFIITRKIRPRVIIIPRGELLAGAMANSPIKKKFYLRILNFFLPVLNPVLVATSEAERSTLKSYFSSSITLIPNLIDEIDEQNNFPSEARKGLCSIGRLEMKKNQIFLGKINHKIDLIGAISSEENYLKKIKSLKNLNYKGNVDPQKMYEVYNKYCVNLIPTLGENFGHVIIESIIYELPVIIPDTTPWTSLITETHSGIVCDLNPDEWLLALDTILMNLDHYVLGCKKAKEMLIMENNVNKKKWINLINSMS